ncbi:MAG: phosphatidate cytidylyltransferase [Kiritimatiellaeota bacterium]|nr:phosphatidate cytidylyltransferase [Kiritimatiellota bacterium]
MLRSRLVFGIGFSFVALAALVWPGLPGALLFLVLALALSHAALNEYFAMAREMGLPGMPALTSIAAVLLLSLIAIEGVADLPVFNGAEVLLMTFFLVLGFLSVFIGPPPRRDALLALVASVAGFVCLIWSLSFIARLYYSDGLRMSGRLLVIFLIAVTKLGDVGAYTLGTWSARLPGGNHKIVPMLSPKKSWEGFIAGMVFSVITAVLFVALGRDAFQVRGVPVLGYPTAIFLGVLLAILGFVGDIAESALKRAAGSKNSGRIPGLGGVLDVLDSLIFTAPAFYGCIQLIVSLKTHAMNAV